MSASEEEEAVAIVECLLLGAGVPDVMAAGADGYSARCMAKNCTPIGGGYPAIAFLAWAYTRVGAIRKVAEHARQRHAP